MLKRKMYDKLLAWKQQRHDEVFPQYCRKAFEMGQIAEQPVIEPG